MVSEARELTAVILLFVGSILSFLGALGMLLCAVFRLREKWGYKGDYVDWTSLAIGWVGVIFWFIGLILTT